MEIENFKQKIIEKGSLAKIKIKKEQIEKFYKYMNLLIEWNEKVNLTAITKEEEIIEKHFIDSLLIEDEIKDCKKIIDVGTGAGFPGIPIAITNPDIEIVLVDSLNKRINFLEEVIRNLNLINVKVIHGRAEDLGKDSNYREKFDCATARAVAPLNVLLEYLIPFTKVKGKVICMKGPNIEEEIKNSNKAFLEFNCEIEKIQNINIERTELNRNILVINKNKSTKDKYPRKAGMPKKQPI